MPAAATSRSSWEGTAVKTKILMLTPRQIADALRVSVRTVYRRMADGTFPAVRLPRGSLVVALLPAARRLAA
jgi:excisionase family DNA binding protein